MNVINKGLLIAMLMLGGAGAAASDDQDGVSFLCATDRGGGVHINEYICPMSVCSGGECAVSEDYRMHVRCEDADGQSVPSEGISEAPSEGVSCATQICRMGSGGACRDVCDGTPKQCSGDELANAVQWTRNEDTDASSHRWEGRADFLCEEHGRVHDDQYLCPMVVCSDHVCPASSCPEGDCRLSPDYEVRVDCQDGNGQAVPAAANANPLPDGTTCETSICVVGVDAGGCVPACQGPTAQCRRSDAFKTAFAQAVDVMTMAVGHMGHPPECGNPQNPMHSHGYCEHCRAQPDDQRCAAAHSRGLRIRERTCPAGQPCPGFLLICDTFALDLENVTCDERANAFKALMEDVASGGDDADGAVAASTVAHCARIGTNEPEGCRGNGQGGTPGGQGGQPINVHCARIGPNEPEGCRGDGHQAQQRRNDAPYCRAGFRRSLHRGCIRR